MAAKINAGDVGRSDLYFITPTEIQVDESVNGRWQPHDDASVAELVSSYETVGQLQPVQIRKVADNKVSLVMGYRRWKAAVKFNELHPDKPMKLKCVLSALNAEEALIRNIAENRERKETTCVDDAYNMRRLREEYGWADARIAEFYKVTAPYVSQLKKLLTLSLEIQRKVHSKALSLQAALALADLTETEQAEALKEAEAEGGTTTKAVVAKVRKKKVSKGQKQSRSLSEVREYFESLTGPAEPCKPLAELVLAFIGGGITDEDMTKGLNGFFKAEPVAEDTVKLSNDELTAAVARGDLTAEEAAAIAAA